MEEEKDLNEIPRLITAMLFAALILGIWFYLDNLRIS